MRFENGLNHMMPRARVIDNNLPGIYLSGKRAYLHLQAAPILLVIPLRGRLFDNEGSVRSVLQEDLAWCSSSVPARLKETLLFRSIVFLG